MKIRSLLLVPADSLVEVYRRPLTARFLRLSKALKRRFAPPSGLYDGELQYYADLPRLVGEDNVFVFGDFYPHFYDSVVPEACPYPSCHGTPAARAVTRREIGSVLRSVDAVLVSTRAGERRLFVTVLARKLEVPVALFDFKDHYQNYGAPDIRGELTYDFALDRDFDLYFKKDLPCGYGTERIVPVCPAPVRPESYHFPANASKDISLFYSGRPRQKSQADREELLSAVRPHFPDAAILEHESRKTFLTTHQYWGYLGRSRMALSPSGLVWDSYRHCEVGLAPSTALIAPKPYVETVGPPLIDGQNAILYDTECREGRYHLVKLAELVEKIRFYLEHPAERERLAAKWAEDVLSGHTIFARSRYILEQMERAF